MMNMNEELLNDHQFPQLSQTQQSEIIAKRCRGVEQLLRSAHSRVEAATIAEDACRQFANECASEIVQKALIERVQQMVEKFWGK